MRNFSVKICRENQTTHFVLLIFFFFENCGVYEIMWKNIAERGRSQMTIWLMRIACWLPKATNKFSEDVILLAFPQQHLLQDRTSVLRYPYSACLVLRCVG
jgi:hypothetical protein